MKRIKLVALIMSIVMLVTFTPLSLLLTAADGIKEIDFTQEKSNSADAVDSVADPMVDKGIDSERYIGKEITEKRTETSKQFLMDEKFAEPLSN